MPLDPSIPLQVRPPQFESPVNRMAQLLQLQGLQDQRDQAQRTYEDQNRLRSLLSGGADPEALRRGGFLKEANDWEEKNAKTQKDTAAADKDRVDLEHKAIGVYRDAVGAVPDRDSAIQFVTTMHQDPRLKNSAVARVPLEQVLAQIPADPAQLGAWKQQFALGANKFMELNAPKITTRNLGGTTDTIATEGLTGNTRTVSSVANTQSPDSVASNETQRRGQNLVDARARDTNKASSNVYDTERGVLVNKETGLARPVSTMDGKPLPGKDKLTEDQGKATGWLIQANNAYKNMLGAIEPSMGGSPGAVKPGIGDAVAMVPGMSGAGNAMRSDDRQRFVQAASSLSEALLRAATGAGVNKDEAKQKVDELTPQWGDSAAVIKQKKDAIPLYIESLKVRAGPGAGKAAQISSGVSAADDNDPLGLRK